jgi:hypothetical protein
MRKLFFILLAAFSVSAIAKANMPESSDKSSQDEKKAARQENIRKAVESKQFTIELEKLYLSRYGIVDLHSGSNYIIVSGKKTAISAGYVGRQRGLYPIAGIRLTGEPSVFKLQKNKSKGNFKIEMEVTSGNDTFHIAMTISENGYCSAIISGLKMDDTRYSGSLIPAELEKKVPEPDAIKI